MATEAKQAARELLEVTMLLMRSLSAEMRQDQQRLAPAHVGILTRIADGPCSLTDLAQHQSVRLPTMSRTVALLVQRGWAERWVPEQNRRQTLVGLTPEGKRALGHMKLQAEQHIQRLLQSLTDTERGKVQVGLQLVCDALSRPRATNNRKTAS